MPFSTIRCSRTRIVRSFLVVAVMCGIVVWGGLLVTVPILVTEYVSPDPRFVLGTMTYVVGGVVCHQRAARSFELFRVQLPVCARCTGIYAGAVVGALLVFLRLIGRSRSSVALPVLRALLVAASFPTVASAGLEVVGVVDPGNVGRALLGMPLGVVLAWFSGNVLNGALN